MAQPSDADLAILWKAGRLRWLLHASQKEVYDDIRAWETDSLAKREAGVELPGVFPRVYVCDMSRRWGKDYLCALIMIENALRRKKQILTYATALAKDISSIVVPIFDAITATCPLHLKPIYRNSFQGAESGYYFPSTGSIVRLVGVDRSPDSLRGRFSDGFVFSESGFVRELQHVLSTVIIPQLQGRLHANVILNSTPPIEPGHVWDTVLCPDALERGAYSKRTIFDNPRLSDSERNEFIRAAGGLESETCRREYLVERIRSETLTVVPEFDESRHVIAMPDPEWALCYTVIDPGVRDMCGIICGWYDFDRAQLVVRRSWAKKGANTQTVVDAIRQMEAQTFANIKRWDGSKVLPNPFQRYSDTDARLILDLNSSHDLKIGAADKDSAEAALHSMRNAFQADRIIVHPEASEAVLHLKTAIWNKGRTSYERNELIGHADLVDTCKYMWRMANKTHNPNPPRGWHMKQNANPDNVWVRPDLLHTKRRLADKLAEIMPKGRWNRGKR